MFSYYVNARADNYAREYEWDGKCTWELNKLYMSFNKLFTMIAPCQLIINNINVYEGLANGSFSI